jgi:hypothetical protein
MDGIWRPSGVWDKFVNKPEAVNQKNGYSGFEY